MVYFTLSVAGIKRHRGVLTGIFLLVLLASLSLGTVLTVWTNSGVYLRAEMERAGFGALTAWVSGVPNMDALTQSMEALEDVQQVEAQPLIFASYAANGQESDSEGQLIVLHPEDDRYRFFTNDLSGYRPDSPQIAPGEVYLSPSLVSMFGVNIGDPISFSIARSGGTVTLTVKGFYEDPFMGSSMIGMKGFLICEADDAAMRQTIQGAGINALARDGAMLHIFQEGNSQATAAQLNTRLNENTALSADTEFVHSADAIAGFMLILQNAFSGLLIAFVLVLLAVVFVVLGHSIGSTVEADYRSMGILKTIGVPCETLRRVQLLQYGTGILPGLLLGLLLTAPVSRFVCSATLTTTGIRVPAHLPWGACLGAFAGILLLLAAFIRLKSEKIKAVSPMKAIRGETDGMAVHLQKMPTLSGKHLDVSLAVRHLVTGKKAYLGACVVALLLVFFASMVGRMDTWLGADGKGMMDAFNPADHDIGVQMFGEHTDVDAQSIVLSYTEITDSYLLAMPDVAVDGINYTANVISQPERFHLLAGRTCTANDEIVITEFVAADLGVSIGDTLTVTGDGGSGRYIVSGIYSCANDMGANIGMSRKGYLSIGRDNPQLWCHHYFLADPTQKAAITQGLEQAFGGDVHVHENTWPGLFGIIAAMGALVIFMGMMVVVFVLIVTVMTGSKILASEQRDIGIYKVLGFTNRQLRLSFALRFGLAAGIGAVLGTVLAVLLTDPLVSRVMKLAGISSFASHSTLGDTLLPAVAVVLLFAVFAYLAAGKIKRIDLTVLIRE